MNQLWHSEITTPETPEKRLYKSFIGGKPCIPKDVELPVCKICGEPLTFFFQIQFPEGHIWAGKSLAFFFCNSYQKHPGKDWFPPAIDATEWPDDEKPGIDFVIPDGKLDVNRYQTLFRTIVFDTPDGVVRDDYQEKAAYKEITWKASKRKLRKTPILLGNEPIWTGGFGIERPATYEGKPMELLFQVAEYFNFDRLPDAPPEMEEAFFGGTGFAPRKEPNYTLFCDFNRVHVWGTTDPECSAIYINVQSAFN